MEKKVLYSYTITKWTTGEEDVTDMTKDANGNFLLSKEEIYDDVLAFGKTIEVNRTYNIAYNAATSALTDFYASMARQRAGAVSSQAKPEGEKKIEIK